MTISALDEHRLTVDENLTVLYLHLAEARAYGYRLYVLAVLLHSNHHLVEVRSLGSPLQRVLHVKLDGGIYLCNLLASLLLHLRGVENLAAYDVAVGSDEVNDEFGVALTLYVYGKCAVLILCVEVRRYAYVVNVGSLRT